MHIVIDLQSCQNGSRNRGIGRYALSLTRALITRGQPDHTFSVVLSDLFADSVTDVRRRLSDILSVDHIHVLHMLPRNSAADAANAWRTQAAHQVRQHAITDLRPDIVFDPSPLEGLWDDTTTSVWQGRHVNVVTLHDLIPLTNRAQHLPADEDFQAYLRRLEQVRKADVILAVSSHTRNDAIRHLGVDPRKVIVAELGSDNSIFAPKKSNTDVTNLLRRLGVSKKFILNTSPLEHRKNVEGMIAGYAQLSSELRDQHELVIVGRFDDYATKYIAGLATAEGVDPTQVILPGYVSDDELSSLYSRCEAFVFPSLSEGFGLPALEAMACGAPVIGSNLTSIPEVIGRDDLLFDPRDPVDIARRLERLLTDEIFRADVRAYGIRRSANFTWDTTADKALSAMAAAFHDKATHAPSTPDAIGTAWPSNVALIWPSSNKGDRLQGVARRLCQLIAEKSALTVVEESAIDKDEWMAANLEFRPTAWLDSVEAASHRIVHLIASDAKQHAVGLIIKHYGIVIVADEINANPHDIGELPPLWAVDILVSSGAAKLADVLRSGEGGTARMTGGFLDGLAERVVLTQFLSDDLDDPSTKHSAFRAPAIPIARSSRIRDRFRQTLNIDGEKLIVAFVEDEKNAGEIINYARREEHGAKLIVQYIRPTAGFKVEHLITGIWQRYLSDFNYDELLNAADEVIASGNLRERFLDLVRKDCLGIGVPFAEFSMREKGVGNKSGSDDFHDSFQSYFRPSFCARSGWLAALTQPTRGVLPSAQDISTAAIAMAANAVVRREPRVFVDISNLWTPAARRPGPRVSNFLRGLTATEIGGKRIRFCYRRDCKTYTSEGFAATLFGLPSDWAVDDVAPLRAGDLVVMFDTTTLLNGEANAWLKSISAQNATLLALGIEDALRQHSNNSTRLGGIVANFLLRERPSIVDAAKFDYKQPLDEIVGPQTTRLERIIHQLTAERYPFSAAELSAHNKQYGGESDPLNGLRKAVSNLLQSDNPPTVGDGDVCDHFVVFGHVLGTYSLAIINRAVASALETAHPGKVRVRAIETIPVDDFSSLADGDRELVEKLARRQQPFGHREVTICQHYPILRPPEGGFSVSLLAWEETRVPREIVDKLNENFQGVIAPARSVEKALADSGVRIPIGILGQPTQSMAFYDSDVFVHKRLDQGDTTFLHVSSCFPRKGVDVLLRAWQRAFRRSDAVRLVIKTFPNPHNSIEEDVAALCASDEGLAPIEIINCDISEQEMISLYKTADSVVLPTRGEGFNLPALEAMLAGVPLIVTGHGGHRDFCSERSARLLDYDFAPAESHVADRHSLWVNPKEDDLMHALRERIDPNQFQTIEKRRNAAREAALRMVDHSAWVDRLDEWLDAIHHLSPPLEQPRIAWVSTWDVQCGIAQYSSFLTGAMSPKMRAGTAILCDTRTRSKAGSNVHPCWSVQQVGFKETVLAQIVAADAHVIVVQHQDGLISWRELGAFASDHRVRSRTSIIVLHNPRGLLVPSPEEREDVVRALQSVDRILVHSVADVNLLKDLGLVDNVTLFPHGASKGTLLPRPAAEITDRSPIIGCHGFFFYHKGIEKLVSAVAQLRHQWPGLRLRLLNARFPDPVSDAAIASCKELVARLGLDNCVEWNLDFLEVTEIQSKLAACDLIVLPYDQSQDSASGAARIALSSYSPVVATDVNIFAEFRQVIDMVPSNEPSILADRIDKLLRHPSERMDIQKRIEDWLSSHEWRPTAERLEDLIYAQLLKKKTLL